MVILCPTAGGGQRRIGPVYRAWQQLFRTAATKAASHAPRFAQGRSAQVGALTSPCRVKQMELLRSHSLIY